MMQILLIGLGAGATAALLFASVTSGAILSVFLFYLAPLPIMIAALGWSHWAGLMGAVVAAVLLGGAFGLFFFATFLATIGGPAWWLAYLALLGRPVRFADDCVGPEVEALHVRCSDAIACWGCHTRRVRNRARCAPRFPRAGDGPRRRALRRP